MKGELVLKKKITFLAVLLSLVCSLSMTSCVVVDAYKDQKNCDKETKQLLEGNKQPFIDKVKSIYGNDAELTDIKPMTFLATDLLYSVTKADGNLTGTLTLNGKKYEVDLPIIEQVNLILFEGKDAGTAVKELMIREKKDEVSDTQW